MAAGVGLLVVVIGGADPHSGRTFMTDSGHSQTIETGWNIVGGGQDFSTCSTVPWRRSTHWKNMWLDKK